MRGSWDGIPLGTLCISLARVPKRPRGAAGNPWRQFWSGSNQMSKFAKSTPIPTHPQLADIQWSAIIVFECIQSRRVLAWLAIIGFSHGACGALGFWRFGSLRSVLSPSHERFLKLHSPGYPCISLAKVPKQPWGAGGILWRHLWSGSNQMTQFEIINELLIITIIDQLWTIKQPVHCLLVRAN